MPEVKTKENFVKYLSETLIPDLIASGSTATAEDFAEAVYWLLKKEDTEDATIP